MPVLEILGRLCRAPGGEALQALLAQQAPTWLVQMPWLLSTADLETLQRRVVGATRERMLREMAEAIEVLSASQPLVLVLEDLHWSDYSTLDLLAMLARRQEPARLLLLGTYRPAEVARRDHPLCAVQQELHVHGLCTELPLTFLTEVAIAEYLEARFPGAQLPTALARLVRQRTEGNPLFMVNMLEYLVDQGWLAEVAGRWTLCRDLSELQAGLPASLLQMLETQLNRLSPEEQQVLEAGSVAGVEFSAATVAAGLAANVMQVDERCATLVRRSQFLCARGEQTWPDGTVAGCYGFTHALYHEVLYSRLTAARRVYLHQQIGVRAEAAYGVRAGDIATELALHFEQGRDVWRAVTYLQQAANNAQRRYANREAIDHLTKGLVLLNTLPETIERTQQELLLQCALGASLAAAKGYASPEVERTYARARTLCQQVGETPQLFPVLWGLLQFYMERGELQTARELGERLLRLAQSAQDPALLLAAHNGLGTVLSYLAELLPARAHLEQSSVFYDPHKHHFCAFLYGIDLGADSLAHAAYILWLLGYPEQALRRSDEALTLAQALAHPFSLAHVLDFTAVVHHLRREEHLVQERAEAGRLLSDEHGFAQELGRGLALGGWALVVQGQVEEGLRHLHQGLAAYQATRAQVWQPYYQALLAEAYGKGGQIAEGLRLLTEALTGVATSGAHWWEAELHRLKGELLLVQAGTQQQVAEAEQCFQQARAIARHQQAKSLELRAAMSLSRLWQAQGERVAAHQVLAEIYGWFTEGFDTADLQEARALLAVCT